VSEAEARSRNPERSLRRISRRRERFVEGHGFSRAVSDGN
jgi:hypothetical protein